MKVALCALLACAALAILCFQSQAFAADPSSEFVSIVTANNNGPPAINRVVLTDNFRSMSSITVTNIATFPNRYAFGYTTPRPDLAPMFSRQFVDNQSTVLTNLFHLDSAKTVPPNGFSLRPILGAGVDLDKARALTANNQCNQEQTTFAGTGFTAYARTNRAPT